jgi:predicted ATPase
MIRKVAITDNANTPLHYLKDLPAFENGKVYEFKEGVNIIVGENGCGKTTLMKLIEAYTLVDKEECSTGMYNGNINDLYDRFDNEKTFRGGAEVYADYTKNIFRMCHKGEKNDDNVLDSFDHFGEYYMQMHSSTGQGVLIAMNTMFKRMFSEGAKLTFDYDKVAEARPAYARYIEKHKVEGEEWTILMDEPDRNLDIENIGQIRGILSFHKPQTQVIAVVHNPLLICALSKSPEINIIELTEGYVERVRSIVEEMVR